MILSQDTAQTGRLGKTAGRKVTFRAATRTPTTRTYPSPNSPLFGHLLTHSYGSSAAAGARARTISLSQHLAMMTYAEASSYSRSLSQADHYQGVARSVGTHSAEGFANNTNSSSRRRTQSAKTSFSPRTGQSSPRAHAPSQQYGSSGRAVSAAPPYPENLYVSSSKRQLLANSSTAKPTPVQSSKSTSQRRLQRSSKTTTSVPFGSRRLGERLYPRLEAGDLNEERAFFRSGVCVINDLLKDTSRSQSARWRWMGPAKGGVAGGDSFCRSALAESQRNNAHLAGVYHVVPERVVSARGGAGLPGVSVALQRLNQSSCHRHALLNNFITNTAHNDNASSDTGETETKRSSSADDHAEDNKSDTRPAGNVKVSVDKGDDDGRDDGCDVSTFTASNASSSNNEVSNNDVSNNGTVDVAATSNNDVINDVGTSPKRHPKHTTENETDEESVIISERRSVSLETLPPAFQQALKGVDIMQQRSPEWLEETRLKNDESVAILSKQLNTMIPGSSEELDLSTPSTGKDESTLPSSEEGRLVLVREKSPQKSHSQEIQRFEKTEEEGRAGKREISKSALCMKTMQCEVLGPYTCSDCTKIRLHERQHQEQMALYPGVTTDPRTLIAPERLRRITASLPSSLLAQRYTLDCGCAIRMHPDFLFPVIVTDNEIISRIRALKSTPSKTEGRAGSGVLNRIVFPDGGERGKGEEGAVADDGDDAEDVSSMSPTDMKVTVRYNTPSPDQKGIFLTN
ncbi:uncharacterized protein [Littorina saxatilis]|uniref:Uncharacterized protein n=1 Tax=Littorina saxatilis TaxID=31220 RepID=A0AAN9GIY2_9CAEN